MKVMAINWMTLSFGLVQASFSSTETELNLSTKFLFKSMLTLTAV